MVTRLNFDCSIDLLNDRLSYACGFKSVFFVLIQWMHICISSSSKRTFPYHVTKKHSNFKYDVLDRHQWLRRKIPRTNMHFDHASNIRRAYLCRLSSIYCCLDMEPIKSLSVGWAQRSDWLASLFETSAFQTILTMIAQGLFVFTLALSAGKFIVDFMLFIYELVLRQFSCLQIRVLR